MYQLAIINEDGSRKVSLRLRFSKGTSVSTLRAIGSHGRALGRGGQCAQLPFRLIFLAPVGRIDFRGTRAGAGRPGQRW